MNIDLFKQRFIHRSDAFSYQWKSDKGFGYTLARTGECTQTPPCGSLTCKHRQNVPISDKIIERHLMGKMTIASYALSEDNTVKWLCLDVDIRKPKKNETLPEADVLWEQAREHTLTLGQFLRRTLGPNRFIVEFSGTKGYHIWVFFSEPVQARHVLAFAQWVNTKVPFREWIHVEIYPKQQTTNNFGNMVKMPMGVHMKSGNRCEFIDANFEPYSDQWDKLESVQSLSNHDLMSLIRRYNIPMVTSIRTYRGETPDGALPCMVRMMDEGLYEGTRDHGIFALAVYLKDKGLPTWAIDSVCHGVNERSTEALSDDVIEKKITSAEEGDYSVFPCSNDILDYYCTSNCRFWDSKAHKRWPGDPKDAVGKISRD